MKPTADTQELLRHLDNASCVGRAGVDQTSVTLAPCIFAMFADDVCERGLPNGSWGPYDRLLALNALVALPARGQFAGLIRGLLELGRGDGMTAGTVAQTFVAYVEEGDDWAADIVVESIAAEKAGSEPLVDPAIAMTSLGIVGGQAVIDALVPIAERARHPLSYLAALVLARMGCEQAEPMLHAQLERRPRPETIEGLGLLRSKSAGAALTRLITRNSLGKVAGRSAEHAQLWLGTAGIALARIGHIDAADILAEWLDNDVSEALSVHAGATLLKLGDERGYRYLAPRVEGWTATRWGTEPFQDKWEAATALSAAGHTIGSDLLYSWYSTACDILPAGKWPSQPGERWRHLQALGLGGDRSNLAFLDRVAESDFSLTEKGWTQAAEAQRSIARVVAREARFAS